MHLALSSGFFGMEVSDPHRAAPLFSILKNVKVAICQEPQEVKFLTCLLKRMTGNDRITSRKLHSNNYETFEMKTKFIICSNNPPEFTTEGDDL
jgi:phage/plasmid-associated DNA primase